MNEEKNRNKNPQASETLAINDFKAIPKVELHVHLDCCLSFDAVAQLRPGISREIYNRQFIAPAKCKDLAGFLKTIGSSLQLMQTEKALRLVTADLFNQFRRDNVVYAEIRFAPLLHTEKGLSPEQVVKIVEEAVSQSSAQTGVEARILLCTLRHFTQSQSLTTAQLAVDFKGTRVVGLDLAADEAGFPIDAHIKAFELAHRHGIPCTAHAGEAKGAESVRETLDFFKPSRIGHGVRSIEEPALLEELKEKNIHLEVCPSCNIQVNVFDRYENHPIDRLYRAGVSVGINTDGRTVTDISLSQEYQRIHKVFQWQKGDFVTCNRNALKAAFLPEAERKKIEEKL